MDPMLPPDPAETPPPSSIAAIRTEDHVVWGDTDTHLINRVEPRFVVVSWLTCLAATLVIGLVSALIVRTLSDRSLTGGTDIELGVLTIIAAMSTMIGFAVVMTLRLVRVQHDRLTNSLAVAALHIAVAGVAALVGVFVSGSPDALIVLERSAAATIIGCGLAVGMVPAVGERPVGTQREPTDTDRQL